MLFQKINEGEPPAQWQVSLPQKLVLALETIEGTSTVDQIVVGEAGKDTMVEQGIGMAYPGSGMKDICTVLVGTSTTSTCTGTVLVGTGTVPTSTGTTSACTGMTPTGTGTTPTGTGTTSIGIGTSRIGTDMVPMGIGMVPVGTGTTITGTVLAITSVAPTGTGANTVPMEKDEVGDVRCQYDTSQMEQKDKKLLEATHMVKKAQERQLLAEKNLRLHTEQQLSSPTTTGMPPPSSRS
ncbi:cell wall protein DAN4-like [Cryptomeria japonica]|uniref:cell wall protein DAN4-like n=1 Tax=Cryptomeria japonica TaxID=3369 RepID=UPI0025AC52E7|nr:cell wall protein DAN4-like [Cryptomeria japonica]